MIQMVDVTVHEVAFHFASLPIHAFPLFKAALKAKFRPAHFPLQESWDSIKKAFS
jgi:hypothetical protein